MITTPEMSEIPMYLVYPCAKVIVLLKEAKKLFSFYIMLIKTL